MQTFLADKHPFALRTRARLLQTQVRLGEMAAAQAAIAEMSDAERGTSEIRIAAAVIQLDGLPARAGARRDRSRHRRLCPTMHPSSAMTEAQVLDAVAREQLGDTRAAEIALETALELAEPQGIVLPFILAPARAILERVPRHRTAHATLRRTILDVLTGEAPTLQGNSAPPLDELSEAELRVVRYLPTNLGRPRSRPSCSCRPTRSGHTSATSTPSSALTGAPRRSPVRESLDYSRPRHARAEQPDTRLIIQSA